MGLAERRAAKNFETTLFPALQKQVAEAAGFDVPIEVAWDTLAVADSAHLYDEAWPKVYFLPLVEAFKAITIDAMGKDALKAALKKIVVVNKSGGYSPGSAYSFEGGTLTVDHESCTNVDDVQARAEHLQKLLEKAL